MLHRQRWPVYTFHVQSSKTKPSMLLSLAVFITIPRVISVLRVILAPVHMDLTYPAKSPKLGHCCSAQIQMSTHIHTYIIISVSVACFCMLHTTTLCKVHVLLNLFLHLHSSCHLFFGHVDLTCRADGTCTVTGLVLPVLEQCTGMKGSMMGVVCRGRI